MLQYTWMTVRRYRVIGLPACFRPLGVNMRAFHMESVTRVVEVDGGGRLTVWDTPGPIGAPTLVLLHGVTLDADTNWSGVTLQWDSRSEQSILHNDMDPVLAVSRK